MSVEQFEVATQEERGRRDRVVAAVRRLAAPALRLSLGLVFVWFGALKIAGESPVVGLVSATIPWVSPGLLLPFLGWVEVVIGVALLVGRLRRGGLRRVALVALAAHLTGTFLTFVMAPHLMISHGNPLLLTDHGEFVLKNLVLITGALVLLARDD